MQTSSTGVSRTRQVVAAVIGNALEWYDFIVYGFLASIIARQFFPSDDAYASLLMALATFGVGFSCALWAACCWACIPTARAARRPCR